MQVYDFVGDLMERAKEATAQGLDPYEKLCTDFGLSAAEMRDRAPDVDTLVEKLVEATIRKLHE